MKEIVIVGAGGFAREVRQIFAPQLTGDNVRFKGYLGKDHGAGHDPSIEGCVLGDPEQYQPDGSDRFVLAIGNMEARQRIVESLRAKGARMLSLVHPLALVADSARLGEGVLIYPYAVVSHDAVLDDCVKLNFFTCVGHNASLGKYCLLAPYATVNGFSVLEDLVYMSTHSTVGPQVRVGQGATISANSCATRDVPAKRLCSEFPGSYEPRSTFDDGEPIRPLIVFGTRPEAIKLAPLVHGPAKPPRRPSNRSSASPANIAKCCNRCSIILASSRNATWP